MITPWTAEQVAAVAADAASVAAARRLAAPQTWDRAGVCAEPAVVFGECQGSGKTPYVTVVDLAGPAWTCTCPSRKLPCKHALALLLLWSAGSVPDAPEPSPAAGAWLDKRSARAERSVQRAAAPRRPPSPATVARRTERITGGVDDLTAWLEDQVARGVAAPARDEIGRTAARLVDAQAPGLAARVRDIHVVTRDPAWPGTLLESYGLLHIVADAYRRADTLPGDLGAVVRRHVGEPTRTDDVLAQPPLRDVWDVLAIHTDETRRPAVHRTHLRGRTCGRSLVLVEVGPRTAGVQLAPGTSIDADLHPHPADRDRAVLGTVHRPAAPIDEPPHADPAHALTQLWTAAVTADPWIERHPVVLSGADLRRDSDGGWVVDLGGDAVAVVESSTTAAYAAVAGGRPATLVGDCTPHGLELRSIWDGRRLVTP